MFSDQQIKPVDTYLITKNSNFYIWYWICLTPVQITFFFLC